jgi:hypothetical protein
MNKKEKIESGGNENEKDYYGTYAFNGSYWIFGRRI